MSVSTYSEREILVEFRFIEKSAKNLENFNLDEGILVSNFETFEGQNCNPTFLLQHHLNIIIEPSARLERSISYMNDASLSQKSQR